MPNGGEKQQGETNANTQTTTTAGETLPTHQEATTHGNGNCLYESEEVMPNWVNNTLSISGESQEAACKLLSKNIFGSGLDMMSFRGVIPPPDTPEYNSNDIENPDMWYNWNCKHWGTKWDASQVSILIDDDAVTYRFDTAWSPPMPVAEKLSEIFPESIVSLEFLEETGWGGFVQYKNGVLVMEQSHAS